MANLNLKQRIKCLMGASDSNKSFLDQISDSAKAYGKQFIKQAVGPVVSYIKGVISNVTSEITSIANTITNMEAFLANALNTFTNQFNNIVKAFDDNSKCADALANTKTPKVNVVSETTSLPKTNEDSTPTGSGSSSSGQIITATTAYTSSQTKSLTAQATAISNINKVMANVGIAEKRELVRTYSDIHPNIATYVDNLSYFKPYSEYAGSTYFGYCVDKPSLPLNDWKSKPKCIRKVLKEKLPSDLYNTIESSYTSLNTKFYGNISKEFFKERNTYANLPINVSHGFHIAGDASFYAYHMLLNSQSVLMLSLFPIYTLSMGDLLVLVNYLSPIKESITVSNDTYTIEKDGTTINIDKKGNVARSTFTKTDYTAVMPEVK